MRMRKLGSTLKVLIIAVLLGYSTMAAAQYPGGNPGVGLDSRTLRVQARAEELYERGDYRRAHLIYLNDLAPIGDKYAQYMLGFMSLSGLGVDQDPVLASAWYRLAAERGAPGEFVAIRDELLAQLDSVDRDRSDDIYVELCRDYSDIAVSMRAAREEFDKLSRVSTGSRLGNSVSPITIVEPGGASMSIDVLNRHIRLRIQGHLDRITAKLGIERIDAKTVTARELANLEEQVQVHLSRMDNR